MALINHSDIFDRLQLYIDKKIGEVTVGINRLFEEYDIKLLIPRLDDIENVSANIDSVVLNANNIDAINTNADNIDSIISAYEKSKISEAEALTADSYANEPHNVYVKDYYYDSADDSIKYNDVIGVYSSLHWSLEATKGSLTYIGPWDMSSCTFPPNETANGMFYIISVNGGPSCSEYTIGDWLVWDNDNLVWQHLDWTFDWNAIINIPENVINAFDRRGDTLTGEMSVGTNGKLFSSANGPVLENTDANGTPMTQLIVKDNGQAVINNHKIWHDGNDGADSGLNADMLDGYQPNTLPISDDTQAALDLKSDTTHNHDTEYEPLGTLHDDRYFQETEFIVSSSGTVDGGKPIKLNGDGKIDATMLGDGVYLVGDWTPTAGDETTEYPDVSSHRPGAWWLITGVDDTNGYTFATGDLAGQTIYNGNALMFGESSWVMFDVDLLPTDYYKLDGSQPLESHLAAGGFQLKSIADGTDDTDSASVGQLNSGLATKSDTGHTHTESDITDLDKYTQSEVDGLLAPKADMTYVDSEIDTREPSVAVGSAGQVWATNADASGKEWITLPTDNYMEYYTEDGTDLDAVTTEGIYRITNAVNTPSAAVNGTLTATGSGDDMQFMWETGIYTYTRGKVSGVFDSWSRSYTQAESDTNFASKGFEGRAKTWADIGMSDDDFAGLDLVGALTYIASKLEAGQEVETYTSNSKNPNFCTVFPETNEKHFKIVRPGEFNAMIRFEYYHYSRSEAGYRIFYNWTSTLVDSGYVELMNKEDGVLLDSNDYMKSNLAIEANTDLNDYKIDGVYICGFSIEGVLNRPEELGGTLTVKGFLGSKFTQVYEIYGNSTENTNNRTYERRDSDGTWSPWTRVINSSGGEIDGVLHLGADLIFTDQGADSDIYWRDSNNVHQVYIFARNAYYGTEDNELVVSVTNGVDGSTTKSFEFRHKTGCLSSPGAPQADDELTRKDYVDTGDGALQQQISDLKAEITSLKEALSQAGINIS